MDRNVCGIDRVGRILLAMGLLVVGYRTRQRTLGTLAFVAGSDLLATAVIQRCPLNALLGIDTCDTAQQSLRDSLPPCSLLGSDSASEHSSLTGRTGFSR